MTNTNECPDCCGDGVIKVKCTACNGLGKILPRYYIECTQCGSEHIIEIPEEVARFVLFAHNVEFEIVDRDYPGDTKRYKIVK